MIYERLVDEEFEYHITFSGGDVEIVEMTLGSKAEGITIEDFEIKRQLRVAAVRRGTHTHIPDASFELREDDLVVAAVRLGVHDRLHRYLESADSR